MPAKARIRWIALLVLAAYPVALFASTAAPDSSAKYTPVKQNSADCSESVIIGKEDARMMHSSAKWFMGGMGSGILLGLIGTGVITIVAVAHDSPPTDIPGGVNRDCYASGYESKAKSKNVWRSVEGGLLGTAVLVAAYLATSNQ